EEGLRELMAAMASFPGSVDWVLKEFDAVEKEGKRLGDVITGYLDTNDEELVADTGSDDSSSDDTAVVASDDDDDDDSSSSSNNNNTEEEDTSNGPDPELARQRFEELRKQFKSTERALKKYGRQSEKGQE